MTINAITKLVKLARSPNTSKIFRNFEFRPVYLEGQNAPILPENPAVWKERFHLMGIAGSSHDDDQNDQKNLSICIDQAIASRGTVAVHAEVKILSYMHKEGLMRKAMNNIGVSKLCCPACFEFARAIQQPEVIIAGQHGKWYPFPCVAELEFPSDSQLESICQELLRTFKHDWSQYTVRKRTTSFGNHSDSSTISSGEEELTRDPRKSFMIQGLMNRFLRVSKGKEPAQKRTYL